MFLKFLLFNCNFSKKVKALHPVHVKPYRGPKGPVYNWTTSESSSNRTCSSAGNVGPVDEVVTGSGDAAADQRVAGDAEATTDLPSAATTNNADHGDEMISDRKRNDPNGVEPTNSAASPTTEKVTSLRCVEEAAAAAPVTTTASSDAGVDRQNGILPAAEPEVAASEPVSTEKQIPRVPSSCSSATTSSEEPPCVREASKSSAGVSLPESSTEESHEDRDDPVPAPSEDPAEGIVVEGGCENVGVDFIVVSDDEADDVLDDQVMADVSSQILSQLRESSKSKSAEVELASAPVPGRANAESGDSSSLGLGFVTPDSDVATERNDAETASSAPEVSAGDEAEALRDVTTKLKATVGKLRRVESDDNLKELEKLLVTLRAILRRI